MNEDEAVTMTSAESERGLGRHGIHDFKGTSAAVSFLLVGLTALAVRFALSVGPYSGRF